MAAARRRPLEVDPLDLAHGRVVLNGKDLSRWVEGFNLAVRRGEPTRLYLTLDVELRIKP